MTIVSHTWTVVVLLAPSNHRFVVQMRDLNAIGSKIVQVLNPTGKNAVLRDWDLWGPLIVGCYQPALLWTSANVPATVLFSFGRFIIDERCASSIHWLHGPRLIILE